MSKDRLTFVLPNENKSIFDNLKMSLNAFLCKTPQYVLRGISREDLIILQGKVLISLWGCQLIYDLWHTKGEMSIDIGTTCIIMCAA